MCFHDFQPKCVTFGEDADFKVKVTRWNVEKHKSYNPDSEFDKLFNITEPQSACLWPSCWLISTSLIPGILLHFLHLGKRDNWASIPQTSVTINVLVIPKATSLC